MSDRVADAAKLDLTEAYFEKPKRLQTASGFPVKELYTPEDLQASDYPRNVGDAGSYPFTRGVHHNMYRGRFWTRREVCGYDTPSSTNERLRFLAETGVSGLGFHIDLTTQFQMDADHPRAEGEIGVVGVPLYSIEDMEDLVQGIAQDKVSMIIIECSCIASAVLLAQYIAVAEKRGLDPSKLRGTSMNDPLHGRISCNFIPQNPIGLALKMATDITEYCTKYMPFWNPTNVNMYDLRETRINAAQEIAFAFSIATTYIDAAIQRGLDIDDFAPRRAFYVSANIDFFEEIAKMRAARRMWARIMKEKYKAKSPDSWRFRFGVHTAGHSLTPQQPLNNIVRVAYEALAAVLGGAQSISPTGYDEPVAIPTEQAHAIAVRTQQILAYETGVTNVADPLGGSYYIESLTDRVEEEAGKILAEIDEMGGAVGALESGWFIRQEEKALQEWQEEIDARKRIVVGLNSFVVPEDKTPGGYHAVDPRAQRLMIDKVRRLKDTRDNQRVRQAIDNLRREADKGEKHNLMPVILDAVKASATLSEIAGTIREAYGYSYDVLDVMKSPF